MPSRRATAEEPRSNRLSWVRERAPELIVATVALLLVVADFDPTGTYAWLPDGPGLTIDESFNVQQGVRLEVGGRYLLLGAISTRELFGEAEDLGPNAPLGYHLADHPPLGRYLLGVAHNIVTAFAMPADWPTPFVTAASRFGSAFAFAATVFLVGRFTTRQYGRVAGLIAAAGLVAMPRVFGHAHIASLETMIGYFYAVVVLTIADRWNVGDQRPVGRTSSSAGRDGHEEQRAGWRQPNGTCLTRRFPSPWGEGSGVRGCLAACGRRLQRFFLRNTLAAQNAPDVNLPPSPPAPLPRERGDTLTPRKTGTIRRQPPETSEGGKPHSAPISMPAAVIAGVMFGLALLTKVQAVLLPIPIAAWALWHWRAKAIVPLAIFGGVGVFVFFAGWPWLWLAPVEHVREYLGRTTDRISLSTWYLGQSFADVDVPWHYPFVMFAVTVPVGLHALGLLGTFVGRRDPAVQLVVACLAFPLVVFAMPGVAVYDGTRLFLVSFPLWAVLVGRGGGVVWNWLQSKSSPRVAAVVLTLFLAFQAYAIAAYRPAYLSYYNLLVGGLSGAERLGFEPTYWGDSITSELLDAAAEAVPEGGTIAVSPVLHQFQLQDLLSQSPALRRRNVRLIEYGRPEAENVDALLVFFRRASLLQGLQEHLEAAEPLAAVRHGDVTLAAVYEFP